MACMCACQDIYVDKKQIADSEPICVDEGARRLHPVSVKALFFIVALLSSPASLFL